MKKSERINIRQANTLLKEVRGVFTGLKTRRISNPNFVLSKFIIAGNMPEMKIQPFLSVLSRQPARVKNGALRVFRAKKEAPGIVAGLKNMDGYSKTHKRSIIFINNLHEGGTNDR